MTVTLCGEFLHQKKLVIYGIMAMVNYVNYTMTELKE